MDFKLFTVANWNVKICYRRAVKLEHFYRFFIAGRGLNSRNELKTLARFYRKKL